MLVTATTVPRSYPSSWSRAAQLAAGRFDNEVPDVFHEPGLLGDRDEHARRDRTLDRMLPSQQRLCRDHFAGPGVRDRLVVQQELVVGERIAQHAVEPEHIGAAESFLGVVVSVAGFAVAGFQHRSLGEVQ